MAAEKFKVGDEVVVLDQDIEAGGRCILKQGRVETVGMSGITLTGDGEHHSSCYFRPNQLRKISKEGKPFPNVKFVLAYGLRSAGVETFADERGLRNRIAELSAEPDLKRDSIKVYDIKRVRNVELGVKITIK